MANVAGEKELKRNWPIITGLGIDDKHEGRQINLIPLGIHGVKSLVLKKDTVGL